MGEEPTRRIRRSVESHEELEAYGLAFTAACRIFPLSESFPREEISSLTDQIRRASRSVCANISEGWRRRRYLASFVNTLNESEAEAAETEAWSAFAVACISWKSDGGQELDLTYDRSIGKRVNMIDGPYPWPLKNTSKG